MSSSVTRCRWNYAAASSESAAISPLHPLLLWLIHHRFMLFHLRPLSEQFLLYFFVYLIQPQQKPCTESCFSISTFDHPQCLADWFVTLLPAFLSLLKHTSWCHIFLFMMWQSSVTSVQRLDVAIMCFVSAVSPSFNWLLVEHCSQIEIIAETQRRWTIPLSPCGFIVYSFDMHRIYSSGLWHH